MRAAAVAYQEYSSRVIRQRLGSLGSGPRKEESQQLENVLRVCGMLQSVVRLCQTIVRHDHWKRRVRGKVSREDAVIFLVLTLPQKISSCDNWFHIWVRSENDD